MYRTAYLHFQLQNCGANIPVVPSSTTVVQDSFDLRPATPGSSISGTILGNDQILCGNVASTLLRAKLTENWSTKRSTIIAE
jgi:hypothetical protein